MATTRKAGSVPSTQLYDTIGATYTVTRRTEPRIAARNEQERLLADPDAKRLGDPPGLDSQRAGSVGDGRRARVRLDQAHVGRVRH